MTDILDPKSREDLIEYKLEKSQQALQEADVLEKSGFFNAAVNRLYYAAYYAASALLLGASLETVTHKGIKVMLGLKFIQTGKLDKSYGQTYQRLFDSRQAGDYEDFVYHDENTYGELKPLAESFVAKIEEICREEMNGGSGDSISE